MRIISFFIIKVKQLIIFKDTGNSGKALLSLTKKTGVHDFRGQEVFCASLINGQVKIKNTFVI